MIKEGDFINNDVAKIFICFASLDRYSIAEPIVYHLKNYGIHVWYDRYELVMGDNRIEKNLQRGAGECDYAIIILSKNTINSICASEEIGILEDRYKNKEITIFPILYEISPREVPISFIWIKEMIFKEVNRQTGSREICNHIACKITEDIKLQGRIHEIQDILELDMNMIPVMTYKLLLDYQSIDSSNLNSKITLLYATYLSLYLKLSYHTSEIILVSKIFNRIFTEIKLNLLVDYRELWLLENSICILVECYKLSRVESNI